MVRRGGPLSGGKRRHRGLRRRPLRPRRRHHKGTAGRHAVPLRQATEAEGDLSAFVDAEDVSNWALESVRRAVANGILGGRDGARLDPQGAARAEAAAMIRRFAEK